MGIHYHRHIDVMSSNSAIVVVGAAGGASGGGARGGGIEGQRGDATKCCSRCSRDSGERGELRGGEEDRTERRQAWRGLHGALY